MRRIYSILISASTASLMAFAALADDSHNAQTNAWDGSKGNDVDNTGRNVRDRDEQTLTPLDQGNRKSDVTTTAQIRRDIIAATNMSVNARNVKIITTEGKVTLRGPVNTDEDKTSPRRHRDSMCERRKRG